MYQHITVPPGGQKITVNKDYSLNVPDQPIIPYIEGDGTGLDITPVMLKVVDAAVAKAYGGKKKIHWMEVYAGEKSTKVLRPGRVAAGRNAGRRARVRGLDQGPADDAGGRWHPARSTWRCGKSSTFTFACDRSSISKAFPRR